eukprot:46240-Hanusia_phi.AAC.1
MTRNRERETVNILLLLEPSAAVRYPIPTHWATVPSCGPAELRKTAAARGIAPALTAARTVLYPGAGSESDRPAARRDRTGPHH